MGLSGFTANPSHSNCKWHHWLAAVETLVWRGSVSVGTLKLHVYGTLYMYGAPHEETENHTFEGGGCDFTGPWVGVSDSQLGNSYTSVYGVLASCIAKSMCSI